MAAYQAQALCRALTSNLFNNYQEPLEEEIYGHYMLSIGEKKKLGRMLGPLSKVTLLDDLFAWPGWSLLLCFCIYVYFPLLGNWKAKTWCGSERDWLMAEDLEPVC